MRTRRPLSAVTEARKFAEHASQAASQAHYAAAEATLDHRQPKDWGAIFEAKQAAVNVAADAAYKERLANYESATPDATWLVEDLLRWNRERAVVLPSPGDLEISEAQDDMAIALAAAVKALPPDTRWKPDETTPVLDQDKWSQPGVGRETMARVTKFFEANPTATYRQAADALDVSPAAITAAKRRLIEDGESSGVAPPAWALRPVGRGRPRRVRGLSDI